MVVDNAMISKSLSNFVEYCHSYGANCARSWKVTGDGKTSFRRISGIAVCSERGDLGRRTDVREKGQIKVTKGRYSLTKCVSV